MVGETEQMQRFAFALQRAMEARKVSARQLGLALKVDARHIARWLKAKDLPNLYQAEALVQVLRVREELFRDPPPVPLPPTYPISDYLLDAADALVSDAVAAGAAEGRRVARRPLTGEAPSGPVPSPRPPSVAVNRGSR